MILKNYNQIQMNLPLNPLIHSTFIQINHPQIYLRTLQRMQFIFLLND